MLRDSSGLGGRARAVLDRMVDRGEVERLIMQKAAGRGTRSYEGYRLVVPVLDPELEDDEPESDGDQPSDV